MHCVSEHVYGYEIVGSLICKVNKNIRKCCIYLGFRRWVLGGGGGHKQ